MRCLPATLSLMGILLHAQTLPELVSAARSAPPLKAAAAKSAMYGAESARAQSARYPSLDASFSGTFLKERPVVYLQGSPGGLPPGTTLQTQAQELYFGALKLTYPLFTGFAVTAGIDAAKLRAMQAQLEEKDARRNLSLQLVYTYAEAVAMQRRMQADDDAATAMQDSYDKAQGFYDKGLLTESDLLRIKADRLATDAVRLRDRNRFETALLQLSYLSDTNVTSVAPLPPMRELTPGGLLQKALAERPDLQVLETQLQLARTRERAAESGYYPTVALYGRLASQGDTWQLAGDGFTNKDKSAVGFEVTYNLFSGFNTAHACEAAQQAQLSARWAVTAYTKQIETEIRSGFLALRSLQNERDAARARVEAETAYAAQIRGQFDHQLADADRLSRAIAARAKARSELAQTEAALYAAYARLLLQVGPDTFDAALKE